MNGHEPDGLTDQLAQLLDDYRSGSSPSEAVAARIRDRLELGGALPAAAKASSLALRVVIGLAVLAGGGVVASRLADDPRPVVAAVPEREPAPRIALAAPEAAAVPASVVVTPISPPLAAAKPAEPATVRGSTRARGTTASSQCTVTLADELEVLERGRVELGRGRYARALALLDGHERRCAAGPMSEERRALRSLALCGSGELQRGREHARALLTANPSAALSGRIRRACALDE
ncbi:MAG: hypothetical protein IAG13_24880 [Deltaproteobacteria bacterium]|nr:hypothetical protein [Nannocystaceae bacterium]